MTRMQRSPTSAEGKVHLGASPTSEPVIAFVRALARWAVRNDLRERAKRASASNRRAGGPAMIRTLNLDESDYRFKERKGINFPAEIDIFIKIKPSNKKFNT